MTRWLFRLDIRSDFQNIGPNRDNTIIGPQKFQDNGGFQVKPTITKLRGKNSSSQVCNFISHNNPQSKPQIRLFSHSLSSSMDTFSSSVSTLKVHSLPSSHRDVYHFKTAPCSSPKLPSQPHAHVSSSSKPNLTPKTKPFSHKGFPPSLLFSSSSSSSRTPSSQNPIFYRNPATGYAAAVIDIAQSTDSLHLVQRDAQKLLGFLKNVNFEESAMVRAVLEQGRFHRHLVVLVKMLLKKNKFGIVRQVLEEFERIYDELCGTQVVLVSSATKMEEDQLFGIAENVQKMSGAFKVKVKNLVHENLPSFAV